MTMKRSVTVGINGFGRMGRLSLRAGWDNPALSFVQINDPNGNAETHAHLLNFDSVHGIWQHQASVEGDTMVINGQPVAVSQNKAIGDTDWSSCDIVIEASGVMRDTNKLQAYLDQGVKYVVVTAPVEGAKNMVMGINHGEFKPSQQIVTAASCTTNCLAPVIKVVQEHLGIRHGSMTSIHDLTNTQTILDAPHKDLRRARACGSSLIPTTTGSAKAIAKIFPELTGKLNGHAVRVPLANASLTDMVFELERETTTEEVNQLFKQASENELKDILGYKERPLVSIDYKTDPRSAIVDALSTMVVQGTQLKVYAWYDNEWGYVNRTVELAAYVAKTAELID